MKRLLKCHGDHQWIEEGDANQLGTPHEGCGEMVSSQQWIKPEQEREIYTCKICGAPSLATYCEPIKTEMLRDQVCFDCNFWGEKIQWRLEERKNVFVIDGQHMTVAKDEPEGDRRWSGCGGSKFIIIANDGRRIVTHNLWHQGKVPDRFRDVLTDNATFETTATGCMAAVLVATNESVRYTSERPSDLEIQANASAGRFYNAEKNCFEQE